MLWGDMEWPDDAIPPGPDSFEHLLDRYYAAVPDGVVNDRWNETHWDFRTSEYQALGVAEHADVWENCRGIGLSFGYNQVEDDRHHLDGPAAVRHLVDVVSRGGNLLLNVGPDAHGQIPEPQRRCLEQLGDWMAHHGGAVHGTRPLDPEIGRPGGQPWVRWTRTGDVAHAVVDAVGAVTLPADPRRLVLSSARLMDGTPLPAVAAAQGVGLDLPPADVLGPRVVDVDLRG